MTRLILVTEGGASSQHATVEDPRPWHELVKAIHTGKLIVTGVPTPQRALVLPERAALAVVNDLPPVLLTEKQYDILFLIARGLTLGQISLEMHISTRMVSKHLENIKAAFNVWTREEALMKAVELGLL
jgi:DNA-binding CsgD family transcriptional regulator